ncbi:family 43 glycosylhydrolase [Candidatus Sumerlaeota bacterium]|nr:family 43 glycosylhydrolase [Candidatus Sumerlaeota bacterium]
MMAAAQQENASASGARERLIGKIDEGGKFTEKDYSFESWNNLRFVMHDARELMNKQEATTEELEQARIRVQQAIDALKKREALPDNNPRIALSASLFATDREGPVNNVALMWAAIDPSDSIEIYRAHGNDGDFTKIYSGHGASFKDYNLEDGVYTYRLVAYRDGYTQKSEPVQVATIAMPDDVQEYSNETGKSSARIGEPLKAGDTYYRLSSVREDRRIKHFIVKTSLDGENWTDGPVVMDQSSHPDLDDFKFESGSQFYDKIHNRIVWWCHWERSGSSYGHGRAMVATAKPGERFTVHHIYNPLGVQVRDMSVFVDDDDQGYLVAASNIHGQGANATLYIFKLNTDYTDVTGIVNKVMEDGYREAPHIIKTGGFYYLVFSQAAGWYPSCAGYMSAKSLDGRWSDLRYIGNNSTFSAQSGGIIDYGHGEQLVPVMMANRWIRGEGTSGNVVLPIQCKDGFAFCDYFPDLLFSPSKNRIIPLDAGRLLSQDQPASSSIPGNKDQEVAMAFDGDYATFFRSDEKTWPFSVTTDLGENCTVRNVQISWHIHKGSEAYYKYTIEGSADGDQWRLLLDRTDEKDTVVSKTYGFSSDILPDASEARYVRINVQRAVLHNNPNNWYPPTLYEVKVYGEKTKQAEPDLSRQ